MAASSSSDKLELKCIFCSHGEDDKKYGRMVTQGNWAAHNFCLLFSSGLAQKGDDSEGLEGFLVKDVLQEKQRCRVLKCGFCHKKYASVGCTVNRCKKSFHYGCGKDHGVLYLYFDNFRAYCKTHQPAQKDLTAEERASLATPPDDNCLICYEPLQPIASFSTILSPCCTRTYYHRTCLEEMAYSAGLHFFKCPLCNNVDQWQAEMLQAGIYIPDRDASWELVPDAYNSLLEMNVECEVDECICPQGRKEDQPDSEWELILCETCGSQACHLACGQLKRTDKEWLCKLCSNTAPAPKKMPKMEKKTQHTCSKQERPSRQMREVTNIR